ncbi:outer membrane protein OmpA-like peptidoglycan-associated protein [Catalinimonas alkaloidigena]|uniref:OmpA family protein n=1 Tax=Catalinimonas alkaloidigena TaxID=1075417 RepID=UPI0024070C63|nr:OmpA family protein [Catalinimonas alkaloidigena]MDF9800039.1 outer membrane protein OmpA-like peptidoglycan-associated protein [Catalinimonas alkaloidigena]
MFRCGIIGLSLFSSLSCLAQISVDTSYTAESLVRQVFVGGKTVLRTISYRGSYQSIGLLETEYPGFPLEKGIILSTGKAKNTIGPNSSPNRSTAFYKEGDEHLDKLSGRTTYDATVLEFTFLPEHNTIAFDYIFASDEYPEYVGKGFNDVFAFILTDISTQKEQNLAIVPNTQLPVHIDNINARRNAEWFIDNTDRRTAPWHDILEYDGMTKLLTAQARVVPGRYYRIKLAIADVDDAMLDSSVMLKEKSFRSFDQPLQAEADLKDSTSAIPHSIILFDWDSSELTEEARRQLQTFAKQVLTYSPRAIRVIGHTDALGTSNYNEKLARKRVQAVVNYLASLGLRGKVSLYRQSKGEDEPVASNTEESGRSQNRRVEVWVEN